MSSYATLQKRIRRIEEKLQLYKPSRAPGVLTSITTRGTSRQATGRDNNTNKSGSTVAVWG